MCTSIKLVILQPSIIIIRYPGRDNSKSLFNNEKVANYATRASQQINLQLNVLQITTILSQALIVDKTQAIWPSSSYRPNQMLALKNSSQNGYMAISNSKTSAQTLQILETGPYLATLIITARKLSNQQLLSYRTIILQKQRSALSRNLIFLPFCSRIQSIRVT